MSKFAYGPASWHMAESTGPQRSPLQFYSTTYSTNYNGGRYSQGPQQCLTRHKGTGYVSNFRPAMSYSAEMDSVDNPPMRKLLADNYDTHSAKNFISYRPPHPNDQLPGNIISYTSGFAHNLPRTLPTEKQVKGAFVDTRHGPGSVPIYPHHTPLLHSTKLTADPICKENAGHGPKFMSTESHTHYVQKGYRDVEKSCASHKEGTGFTHSQNIEPVTFRPSENHGGELPGYITWRPTGASITTTNFNAPTILTGNEPLDSLTAQASHTNGFVEGSKAGTDVHPKPAEKVGYTQLHQVHPLVQRRVQIRDPVEYTNMTNPQTHCTLTRRHYEGQQRPSLSEARRLERDAVGSKEMTGFSENNPPFVEPMDRDAARFSTHYQNRFPDYNPQGHARYGWVANGGGTQPPVKDGWTKSTNVHKYIPPPDNYSLYAMHPYPARSLLKREPNYVDHTHKHKDRVISCAS